MVQEVKRNIGKLREGDWDTKIARYLLAQHKTPSVATGMSPAELLMKRKLRTCLDLLHPTLESARNDYSRRNSSRRFREIEGRDVIVRNPIKRTWNEEMVTDRLGPVTYATVDCDGKHHKRHIDQMRPKFDTCTESVIINKPVTDWVEFMSSASPKMSARVPVMETTPIDETNTGRLGQPEPPNTMETTPVDATNLGRTVEQPEPPMMGMEGPPTDSRKVPVVAARKKTAQMSQGKPEVRQSERPRKQPAKFVDFVVNTFHTTMPG